MLIDPFTVLAQIVNFLILVALLKHFLYGPITRTMAQREQTIAEQLARAEQQELAAQTEAARMQQMQQDFAAHRDQRLAQLRSQIEDQRLNLVEQAEDEVETARTRWYRALDQERAMVLRAFRQQAAYQLMQTVRQVLIDLANADLEQQVVAKFLNRLGQLPESEQQALRAALTQADGASMIIRSSFLLTEDTQHSLTEALQTAAKAQLVPIQFEINAALGCGIELRAPGYKLEWTLAAYLDNLEHNLALTLDQHVEVEPTVISA